MVGLFLFGGLFHMSDCQHNNIKEPKTYEEQIEILRCRNLSIKDEEFAKYIFRNINYYRFSAYGLTLKKEEGYHDRVTLEDIYSLYEFDRKLRLELLSLLEIIEISFRSVISYQLAHKYGATAHLDKQNFSNHKYFEDMSQQIESEINRSREIFVHTLVASMVVI